MKRRVLEGHADDLKPGVRVWWLLLDCGCTTWRPYTNPCTVDELFCGKHPKSDEPPPKERGKAPGEAWLKIPGRD